MELAESNGFKNESFSFQINCFCDALIWEQ